MPKKLFSRDDYFGMLDMQLHGQPLVPGQGDIQATLLAKMRASIQGPKPGPLKLPKIKP